MKLIPEIEHCHKYLLKAANLRSGNNQGNKAVQDACLRDDTELLLLLQVQNDLR